jgi:hypothetical protein
MEDGDRFWGTGRGVSRVVQGASRNAGGDKWFLCRASATRTSPVHCFWPPRGPTRLVQRVRVAALNCLVRTGRHEAVGHGAFCQVVVVGRVVVATVLTISSATTRVSHAGEPADLVDSPACGST